MGVGLDSVSSSQMHDQRGPAFKVSICEDIAPAQVALLTNFIQFNTGVQLSEELPTRRVPERCRYNLRNNATTARRPRRQTQQPTAPCRWVRPLAGSSGDRLLGVDEFVGSFGAAAGLPPPGVVILNTGAHFLPDHKLFPQVRATLRNLTRTAALADALLIWRGTARSHAHCQNATGPSRNASTATHYMWPRIMEQSARIRSMIRREFPRVIVMDIDYFTGMRADMHLRPPEDCAHYLPSPSPIDHWVRMLGAHLRRKLGRGIREDRLILIYLLSPEVVQ